MVNVTRLKFFIYSFNVNQRVLNCLNSVINKVENVQHYQREGTCLHSWAILFGLDNLARDDLASSTRLIMLIGHLKRDSKADV